MTQRLYYDNAYLTSFDAQVVDCVPDGGSYLVHLDQSAFYPTSGGQPYDTGTLGGANILDVFVGNGDVAHRVDAPLPVGEAVHGEIDWPRRFDHMQQHAGEHMLANAVWRQLGGHVIGLHLGAEVSSIDADLPGGRMRISAGELRALEDDVNEKIQRDVPIRCTFPDADTLAKMPLRKPPTVKEHIRIVAIGDFEYVACGGTHPSSSGQIGLLKIVDARPSKGKLRLSFVCGKRAFQNYRHVYDLAHAAAAELSTAVENLPGAVEALRAHLREAERGMRALRRETLLSRRFRNACKCAPHGEQRAFGGGNGRGGYAASARFGHGSDKRGQRCGAVGRAAGGKQCIRVCALTGCGYEHGRAAYCLCPRLRRQRRRKTRLRPGRRPAAVLKTARTALLEGKSIQ